MKNPRGGAAEMTFFWDELDARSSETALIDADGAVVSYASLVDRADRFGAELGAERPLLLLEMENHSSAVVAYVGALRARVPVVMVRAGDSDAIERIEATFAPEIQWSRGAGLVRVPAQRGDLHADLALALSTSGTTGSTKLVRLSSRAVDANARSIAEYLTLSRGERAITSLPASYSYGLSVINSHLAVGASVVLTEASLVEDRFWAIVEGHGVTSFAGVPHSYELLERTRFMSSPPACLRSFTQAGGRLPPERVVRFARLAREHGLRFFVMYGQTEAAPRIAYVPPDELPTHPDCIGRAIPGGRLELVDPVTGSPAVSKGELVYRGPNVMMGYAHSREDLARGAELDALRTGDLAEEVEPGLFRITGRLTRFAKLYGLRVSLDDIEARLAADGIRGFAATDDHVLAVFVEGAGDRDDIASRIARRQGIPQSSVGVVVGDERPLLSSGKTDYAKIVALERASRPAADPRSAAADRLQQGFAELFPRDQLADSDSFSALGGDSLSYVAASLVVEEALGDLPAGWETLTLGELKERARSAAPPHDVRRRRVHVEGEMIARCLAVGAVVVSHSLLLERWFGLRVRGGTDVLMLLFGYNVMRFQGARLLAGQSSRVLAHYLKIFGIPYLVATAVLLVAGAEVDGDRLLLVSNYRYHDGAIGFLWFFEALLQMTILVALAFGSSAWVRAWRSRRWFPFQVVAIAAALKIAAWTIYDPAPLRHRTPDALLFLFAAGLAFSVYRQGWMAAALASLVVAIEVVTWGPGTQVALMAVCLSLLFVRSVAVHAWVGAAIAEVAASAFYVYVANPVVVYAFNSTVGLRGEHPIPCIVASFGAGIALHRLAAALLARRVQKQLEREDDLGTAA